MFTIAIIGIIVGAAVLVGLHVYPNMHSWQELRLELFGPKPKNMDQPH